MRQVNLLPEEWQKAEKIRFIKNSFLILLCPVLGILFIIQFLLNAQIRHLKATAKQPLAFQDTTETRQIRKQIDGYEEDLQQYGRQNKDIIDAFVRQVPVAYLLKIISRLSDNKVWLQAISLDTKEDVCRISGKSFNTRLVSEFMLELKRLPHFSNVELVSVGKETGKTAQEVDFQIICHLR